MSANHNFIAASGYDEALLRLIDLAVQNNAIAIAINAGGTGYTVGDILTVSGGTVVNGLIITLEVRAVAAGVITEIRIFNCGAYSANPANPVAVTGGTGADDATFNLTFSTQNWVVERNDAATTSALDYVAIQSGTTNPITKEREVILRGPGNAGADEIYIGFMEVTDPVLGSFNWHLAGFTGFSSLLLFEDQPGFSYAEPDEVSSFIAMSNGSLECWFHVTPRTLKGVVRIGTTYTNFLLGFLNPFATPSEFPYPLYISGSTGRVNQLFNETGITQSGLCDPLIDTRTGGNANAASGLRVLSGIWDGVANYTTSGSSRSPTDFRSVYPCQTVDGGVTFQPPEDRFLPNVPELVWEALIPATGNPGSPIANLFPTDDSAGNQTQMVPCFVWERAPTFSIFGELEDVFWGSTSGANIVSEDRVFVGGESYRAFQQGNRTDAFAFVFLREEA